MTSLLYHRNITSVVSLWESEPGKPEAIAGNRVVELTGGEDKMNGNIWASGRSSET